MAATGNPLEFDARIVARRRSPIEVPEQPNLQIEPLRYRLNHEVSRGHHVQVGGQRDPFQRPFRLTFRQQASADRRTQTEAPPLDPLPRPVERTGVDVDAAHDVAGHGEHLGDAGAHDPRPDYCDAFVQLILRQRLVAHGPGSDLRQAAPSRQSGRIFRPSPSSCLSSATMRSISGSASEMGRAVRSA